MPCLSVVHHVPKIQYMAAQKPEACKPFVLICGSHHISSSRAHSNKIFNSYTHVFEVQLFTGVVDDLTGNRIIPEIDVAAAQTEVTISAHMTAGNTIPAAVPAPEIWRPPKYNCEALCLIFKTKQQCIFIHSMHYAHVCTYTQDKHNDKVLQSSNSLLHNLNCYTHYTFKL